MGRGIEIPIPTNVGGRFERKYKNNKQNAINKLMGVIFLDSV